MDDDSGHVVFGQRARMTLDPHVLEAVRGVPRFERPTRTVGDDHVDLTRVQGLARGPVGWCEVLHRDVTGRIERFTVGEREARVARPDILHAHPTVDVLAEIDHMDHGAQLCDRARADGFDSPDGRCRRREERRHVVFDDGSWLPTKPSSPTRWSTCCPAMRSARTIDPVALCQPVPVGRDRPTVDLHLDEARDLGTVDVVFTRVADLASVPTVGENDAQLVVTLPQEGRDVEGLHVEVRAVGRESGSELIVADAFAVHEQLVEPVSRRVDPPDRDGVVRPRSWFAAGTPGVRQAASPRPTPPA